MPDVTLIDISYPEFGVPRYRPELPRHLFAERQMLLNKARRLAGYDALVIYADREHAANLAWLTDFSPRFEEALLVLAPDIAPTMLVGPENLARAQDCAIEVEARLYPPFGLLGQDRGLTPALEEVLRHAGLREKQRIGVVGWKYYGATEAARPESWLETPSFIADTLRRIVGEKGRVLNANALFMHPSTGLRARNEVQQIAQFEFGAIAASEAIKALILGMRPGISEFQAIRGMGLGVLPHSCDTMLSSGETMAGLSSPSGREIVQGDPITSAVGYPGGLTSRAGWVAEGPHDLPAEADDYLERLAAPYFACAAEWYETIGIGVTGGELDALVRRHLGAPFFNLVLNPGHLIHIDEWLSTPVYPGSTERFSSGQVVQSDIIPAVGRPYGAINIEDGVALLDEAGRDHLAQDYPQVWDRICTRRQFMAEVLGIRLKAEVLPLSNMAGILPPFWLSPRRVLARG